MTQNDDKRPATEDEISNVDLQFMGRTDTKSELNATVKAESLAAEEATNPQSGMDKQDVASAQSMDASDPPSSNMGDEG